VCGLLIALMMEAARTSETLVNFHKTTWCYNPEDSHLCTMFIAVKLLQFSKKKVVLCFLVTITYDTALFKIPFL
jgi:hypothetical protein